MSEPFLFNFLNAVITVALFAQLFLGIALGYLVGKRHR